MDTERSSSLHLRTEVPPSWLAQMIAMQTKRPPGSNWGDYGDTDRRGRLNELTPKRVRRAAEEIRTGMRFCLSLPLDLPGGNVLHPSRHPPEHRFVERTNGIPAHDFPLSLQREGATGVVNDDMVVLYTQYSTQWDAFSHIGSHFDANGDGEPEICYYNGTYPGPDVEEMAAACIVGRGVMVDLHRAYGTAKTYVDYDMLRDVMRDQKVTLKKGDILALHTGFGQVILNMHGRPDKETLHNSCAALDGSDPELLEWITKSGVVAIVADNFAVEAYPARVRDPGTPFLPLHEHCLFKLGIHLGEIWYLTELALWLEKHDRFRFFLAAPPLRLRGHVGSPANPIAVV
jgi:kynurenine formamidase